jgi:hypothetical protein
MNGILTLRYGEINEDTSLRLCILSEDSNKDARWHNTKECAAFEEGVIRPKE